MACVYTKTLCKGEKPSQKYILKEESAWAAFLMKAGTLLDPAHLARADESKLWLPEEIGTEREPWGVLEWQPQTCNFWKSKLNLFQSLVFDPNQACVVAAIEGDLGLITHSTHTHRGCVELLLVHEVM